MKPPVLTTILEVEIPKNRRRVYKERGGSDSSNYGVIAISSGETSGSDNEDAKINLKTPEATESENNILLASFTSTALMATTPVMNFPEVLTPEEPVNDIKIDPPTRIRRQSPLLLTRGLEPLDEPAREEPQAAPEILNNQGISPNWQKTTHLLSFYAILLLNYEFTNSVIPFVMTSLSTENAFRLTCFLNMFEGCGALMKLINKDILNPENHNLKNYKSSLHYSAYIFGAFFDAFVIGRAVAGLDFYLKFSTAYHVEELSDLGNALLKFNQENQFGRTMSWVFHFYSESGRISNDNIVNNGV